MRWVVCLGLNEIIPANMEHSSDKQDYSQLTVALGKRVNLGMYRRLLADEHPQSVT